MFQSIIRTAKNAANMEQIYLQLSFRTAMLATVETLQHLCNREKDCYFTKVTFISIKFFLSLNLTCKLKIHQLSNKESHDHVKYLKTTIEPTKINNKRLTPVSSL